MLLLALRVWVQECLTGVVGQTIPETFQNIQHHSRDFEEFFGICSSAAKGTEEAPR